VSFERAAGGTSISQGATLLGSIIAARLLGRELFGTLAIVQSTGIAAASIASLGLGVVATRYVSACKESDPARVGRILALCSLMSSRGALRPPRRPREYNAGI
jgi:O-antigen/teichoic acid export membrane protein